MVPVMQHYAIHILPVKALEDFDCELAKPESALISCVGTRVWVDVRTVPHRLILEFADTTDMHRPGAFSRTQAEEIARFARGLPNSVTDVFVCCSEGESRSPAVAAALLRASGRSDRGVLLNPYYHPNALVYRLLCRALGIFMPRPLLWLKQRRSLRAFRRAQQKGNTGGYERWQILF